MSTEGENSGGRVKAGSGGAPCARSVAADVLHRVLSEDAYAAPALSVALERSGLAPRDRGLCTELTYGVLRCENYLRRRIARFAKFDNAAEPARLQLLLGVYQLDFLDRVGEHAAVNEAVRLTRKFSGERSAGFVNAVLRNILRKGSADRLDRQEAIVSSTPAFLRKRLVRDVGEPTMRALLAPVGPPLPTLRLRAGRPVPFPLEQLERLTESSVRFSGGGDPRRAAGYAAGDFVMQELGAQWIAEALAVRPGERVLDVCAGRGQKASLLADQGASVLATDLHPHKLAQLTEEFERLGLTAETATHDWTQATPESWRGKFDAVLVDAPCSGVGTLRRRPEIARRLSPETPARMGQLQVEILSRASEALAPGGRLLFATCSVLREEAEDVLSAVADVLHLAPLPEGARLRENPSRLLPDEHGTDGYFVAWLRRPRP